MIGEEELDVEWVELILQALDLGLTVDEIRQFLQQPLLQKGLISESGKNPLKKVLMD